MTDNNGGTKKQFEALAASANQLNQLRVQVEQAQKQHAHLLKQFLDTVERSPSDWKFEIAQQGTAIAEGPLNKQAQEIFAALGGLLSSIPPGEGAGCPEKTGCTNIGQFGNKCFYLCHTTHWEK